MRLDFPRPGPPATQAIREGPAPIENPQYLQLDTFIVNLMEADGKRYLKSRLDLELNNKEVKLEVDKRLPQIRDNILTLLSGKSFDDIHTLEGKFLLRTEVISMLNQHLKTGKITNVYFTEFIVQ